jgi:ferredoxin
MAKLIFTNTDEEKELEEEASIAQHCEEQGIPFACTEGICGTCIVEVDESEGSLSEPTQQEIDFLGEHGTKRERMCCQCKIMKGTVKIRH